MELSENTGDWLGWLDSNQRMPVPKTGALPLGYTPTPWKGCIPIPVLERKPLTPVSFAPV